MTSNSYFEKKLTDIDKQEYIIQNGSILGAIDCFSDMDRNASEERSRKKPKKHKTVNLLS